MRTIAEAPPMKSIPSPTDPFGVGLLGLTTLAAIAFFWVGLMSLGDAWGTAEYSHGPLIPLLSFVLFLKHLKVVEPRPVGERERLVGIGVIILALLIGGIGNISRIPDIITYGLIVWVFGLILITFGYSRGLLFWAAVVHLVFMLPLPAFIYWKLSITLQFISAEIGVWFIQQVGIPVFLDGNIIDLGAYRLDVAEACSGLRYLFPIMSFSYIFCMLYNGPIWHKAILLISAAPLTMLMNSFRIGVIGILVDAYGIGQAEGFLHFFEGWVIFLSCIAILFGLARVLQFSNGDKRPLFEVLELDFNGLGQQLRRVLTLERSRGLLICLLLTAGAALLTHATPPPSQAKIDRDPLVLFPRTVGDWKSGPPERLDANIERVLGADDYYGSSFHSNATKAPVNLFIAWYRKQTEGTGIHSPEVCIPAGGWEMSRISPTEVTVTTPAGEKVIVPVNRATIRKGMSRQLVYYWFEGRGRRLTSDYVAKALLLYDASTINRSDGALVRLVTPLGPREEESDGDVRLQAFLGNLLPKLPTYVP
jgi:exosortase D (VPLPA-CTERM-specific)